MKTRKQRFVFAMLAMLVGSGSVACGSGNGDDKDPNNNADGGTFSGPPDPASGNPACIISADCPAGQHCDLGECVQTCNKVDPCDGSLTCTPRGRCIEEGAKDEDPPPTTTFKGAVRAPVSDFLLTDRDKTLEVKLESDSPEPVRYRIELNAPHLHAPALRGSFTKSATLKFDVVTAGLAGRDVAGSIRIITTLGEVTVNAPIHVGLTGAYKGTLRYDGGPVHLGNVQLSLEVIEKGGEAKVRVDGGNSLLFPKLEGVETTGRGAFTLSEGLQVTLVQRLPKSIAAGRNAFDRDLGRKIVLKLRPTDRGNLEGTFEDKIYGVFTTDVTLKGSISLYYQPQGKDPEFTVGDEPAMPPAPDRATFLSPVTVLGTKVSCEEIVCGAAGACSDPSSAKTKLLDGTYGPEPLYAKPLNVAFGARTSSTPIQSIATACRAALKAGAYDAELAKQCGFPAGVACTLPIAAKVPTGDTTVGKVFGRMTSQALASALLVAKDDVVAALRESFVTGLTAEKGRYESAIGAVKPMATWVLQPAVLEYLRSMPAPAAKGDDPKMVTVDGKTLKSSETDTYPAARALADLFLTMSTIDGERTRIAAASTAGDQAKAARDAQERALVTFAEAAVLSEILAEWGTVPPSVGAKLLGVLTPMDQGFTALKAGANVFGVPAGSVPFVFRAEDAAKGATNFEQMLAIASVSVGLEEKSENSFLANARTYDSNQSLMQSQLKDVRVSIDRQLKDICGESFDPAAIKVAADWTKCGEGNVGEIGVLRLEIDSANVRVKSAETRILGIKQKIQIDLKRIADKQAVRQETLHFIDNTGKDIAALTLMGGIYDSMMEAMKIAANANATNFGAPMGMVGPAVAITMLKTGLDIQKQQLQTAMSMRYEAAAGQVELIDGMAEVKKQTIDATQAAVDAQLDLIAVVQANLRLQNALARAKGITEERARSLDLLDKDPINDPSFRILRDQQALGLLSSRATAQKQLFLAASALEYELNVKIPSLEGAVMNAHNHDKLGKLQGCLSQVFSDYRVAFGTPQDYATTISVRKLLGINGPRKDEVTGEELSEGAQFRRILLQNANLDGKGGVAVTFSTNLQPGNGLWSSDVCSDRVTTVQAQIVGDFLGDNAAQVNLSLTGGSFMRACDGDRIEPWSLGRNGSDAMSAFAVVQAGVNTFGEASPNTSLFGQAVARAGWKLVIPGATSAPTNSDLQLTKIEDVVLKVNHKALPRRSSPVSIDLSCLQTSGT
jgi:hypothetical protein